MRLLFASLIFGTVLAYATPLHRQSSPLRYRASDDAFRSRKDAAQAQAALTGYRRLAAEHPQDAEAHWRVSMACHFVGLRFAETSDAKLGLFAEGREAGRRAVALSPRCAACHFWTAINMALYGNEKGAFKMLFSLKQILDHLKLSTEADPTYAYSGAYRLLGLIYQKLPGILGGDNDEARRLFARSIATSPEEPMNYLFLAKLLLEEESDDRAIAEIVDKGLEVPPPSADRLESLEALVELRALKHRVRPPTLSSSR